MRKPMLLLLVSCFFSVSLLAQTITWCRDADGDGWGDDSHRKYGLDQPYGYVRDSYPYDCNDSNASVYPDAVEICDGLDNNCNGEIDESIIWYRDADGDGYG